MKKMLSVLAFVAVFLGLSSCTSYEPKLPASKAKSLLKKELARVNASGYASIPIGYFECNDDETRYALRQLAACELITYSCERVQKPERVKKTRRVKRMSYWSSYYDTETYWVNDTVTAYFVTTALTEKGQKLVVDSIPEVEPTDDIKDLRLDKKNDLSVYPESKVDPVEFPGATSTPLEEEGMMEMPGGDEEVEYAESSEVSSSAVFDERSAYERAKANESIEQVNVKAYEVKVVKVRNIIVTRTPTITASAEAVMEYTDVTPFGRVIKKVYDGQRFLEKDLSFVYYQDKKWAVKDID